MHKIPNLSLFTEFEWDDGNYDKNWIKHRVSAKECEEVFFGEENIVVFDEQHSYKEDIFNIYGATVNGRLLFIAFIIRNNRIRVISARDQTTKEKIEYSKYLKKLSYE